MLGWSSIRRRWFAALALAAGLAVGTAEKWVPLEVKLPVPPFMSEPVFMDDSGHWEQPPASPQPPILVPPGTTNLALGKPVTSSDARPLVGVLAEITDGEKEWPGGNTELANGCVVLHRGKQWIQIDLRATHAIYAVGIWRHLGQSFGYHCVVMQVADDADFTQNARPLFNNDYENRLGLGAGTNLLYEETYAGKLIEAKGTRARYVRLYSKGNTRNELNGYNEVEVYGQ